MFPGNFCAGFMWHAELKFLNCSFFLEHFCTADNADISKIIYDTLNGAEKNSQITSLRRGGWSAAAKWCSNILHTHSGWRHWHVGIFLSKVQLRQKCNLYFCLRSSDSVIVAVAGASVNRGGSERAVGIECLWALHGVVWWSHHQLLFCVCWLCWFVCIISSAFTVIFHCWLQELKNERKTRKKTIVHFSESLRLVVAFTFKFFSSDFYLAL